MIKQYMVIRTLFLQIAIGIFLLSGSTVLYADHQLATTSTEEVWALNIGQSDPLSKLYGSALEACVQGTKDWYSNDKFYGVLSGVVSPYNEWYCTLYHEDFGQMGSNYAMSRTVCPDPENYRLGRVNGARVCISYVMLALFEEEPIEPESGDSPCSSCPDTKDGNPIDFAIGNKTQTEIDISAQSQALPYQFRRHYNSNIDSSTSLGTGWRHTYDRSLKLQGYYPDLSGEELRTPANSTYDFYASDPYESMESACKSGWEDIRLQVNEPWAATAKASYNRLTEKCTVKYSSTGSGTLDKEARVVFYQPGLGTPLGAQPEVLVSVRPEGQRYRLYNMSGQYRPAFASQDYAVKLIDPQNNQIGWEYHAADQNIEIYDMDGKLLSIIDRNGNTQQLTYNSNEQLIHVAINNSASLAFTYTDNYITQIRDHANRVWVYGYDQNNNLSSITNPDGTVKTYHYENNDFVSALTGITDERRNRYATYAYDADGRAVTSYHANNAGRIEVNYIDETTRVITDSRGIETTYTIAKYNGFSKVLNVEGPGCDFCNGFSTNVVYDTETSNLLQRTVDGFTTAYGNYDPMGNPGYRIEAAGSPEERRIDYTYDSRFQGKITRKIEPSVFPSGQKLTQYHYDDNANLTQVAITGFDPYGNPISRVVDLAYNGPFHQLTQIDGPRIDVSDVTTIDYYPLDDPNVNNRGRVSRITNAVGIVSRDNMQYSATGKLLSEQRPNGITVTYVYYGGNDRLQSMTETAGGESRTTYWTYLATGEVASISLGYGSPDATTVRFEYDDARRLTKVINSSGDYVEYTLDTEGNRVGENMYDASSTLQTTLSRTFDAYNRLDLEILPDSTTDSDFHPDGTLTKFTDGNQETTTYQYDALKRLTRVSQPGNIDSLYNYNTMDRLTTVTDPNGNATQYTVDDLGNVVNVLSPDTADTAYTYDEAGNILQKVDALQQVTSYYYDAVNRLTQVNYHDGSVETYTYDAGVNGSGLLYQVTDAGGQVTYSYNNFGEITQKVSRIDTVNPDSTVNSVSLSTSYGYNALGLVNHMTYPSGTNVDYGYDHGRITSVVVNGQVVLDNVQYHATGQVQQWTWANGSIYRRSYDQSGRIVAHTDGSDTKWLGYDGNHNITSIANTANSQTFGYDALNRLTGFQDNASNMKYGYDANGNRTQWVNDLNITDYQVDAASNKLLSSAGSGNKVYSHDANGNTLADGEYTFQYDTKNQLISLDDGDTALYQYNALGQRIYKRAIGNPADLNGDGVINSQDIQAANQPGANVDCNSDGNPANSDNGNGKSNGKGNTHGQDVSCIANLIGGNPNSPKVQSAQTGGGNIELYFAYNEQGQLLGEYDANSQPEQETIYLNAIPVATVQNGVVYTVHTDHLNTPRVITDASNTVVWRWEGDPFGNTEADEDPDGDGITVSFNQRFAGQYYDAESGLHYNYFRYYDPSTGRYVTSDPIGLYGGLNTYGYVFQNPLHYVDPLGLDGQTAVIWASGMVGSENYELFDAHPEVVGVWNQKMERFGWGFSNKCNAFLYDALSAGGDAPGRIDGRIPVAAEWFDKNQAIKNYPYLPTWTTKNLKIGDIISNGSHVGIYKPLPDGSPGTISASTLSGKVEHNNWGFRGDEGDITVRRCGCDINSSAP